MCGIFCSKDKNKFIELAKANQYRGSDHHSITVFDNTLECVFSGTYDGLFNEQNIPEIESEVYYVGHVQAATSLFSKIHPNEDEFTCNLLWHNGILKDEYMSLQEEKWDTELINKLVSSKDNLSEKLSDLDGSFACVHYNHKDKQLFIFRNKLSPMFIDNDYNISSVKLNEFNKVEADTVILINPFSMIYNVECKFTTKNNPYYGL